MRNAWCRVHNRQRNVYLRPVQGGPVDARQCGYPRRRYPCPVWRLKMPHIRCDSLGKLGSSSVTDFAHTHDQVFPVRPDVASAAHIDAAGYREAYEQAATSPDVFWAKEAQRLSWIKAPTKIKNTSFTGDVSIKWFEDGVLNASVSCLDRHLAERGDQTAIIWEGDNPNDSKHVTYRELHDQVCRLANAMKTLGVKK